MIWDNNAVEASIRLAAAETVRVVMMLRYLLLETFDEDEGRTSSKIL